jgi:hypothetical protein
VSDRAARLEEWCQECLRLPARAASGRVGQEEGSSARRRSPDYMPLVDDARSVARCAVPRPASRAGPRPAGRHGRCTQRGGARVDPNSRGTRCGTNLSGVERRSRRSRVKDATLGPPVRCRRPGQPGHRWPAAEGLEGREGSHTTGRHISWCCIRLPCRWLRRLPRCQLRWCRCPCMVSGGCG